jgi:hypothetical protein
MFTVFYGVAWVLRGYLIFRSGYLPKLLGVLMTLGGLAFIARNFLLALAPTYAPGSLLLLMLPGDCRCQYGCSRGVLTFGNGK